MASVLGSGLAGAGLGILKSELFDRPNFERQIASRAVEERTRGLQGREGRGFSDIQAPNMGQTALDFGLAGAAFAQNQNQLEDTAQFRKDLLGALQSPQQGAVSAQQQQAFDAGLGPVNPQAAQQMLASGRPMQANFNKRPIQAQGTQMVQPMQEAIPGTGGFVQDPVTGQISFIDPTMPAQFRR